MTSSEDKSQVKTSGEDKSPLITASGDNRQLIKSSNHCVEFKDTGRLKAGIAVTVNLCAQQGGYLVKWTGYGEVLLTAGAIVKMANKSNVCGDWLDALACEMMHSMLGTSCTKYKHGIDVCQCDECLKDVA